jgi:hypothetical protein
MRWEEFRNELMINTQKYKQRINRCVLTPRKGKLLYGQEKVICRQHLHSHKKEISEYWLNIDNNVAELEREGENASVYMVES